LNSNVVLLSHDERQLYVANQQSATVSVLDLDPSGAPALVAVSPTGTMPCGMVLSPAGDRLYVATQSGVFVHEVAADGSLPVLGSVPPQFPPAASPMNGIQYASLSGGDFVYVNESSPAMNQVTAWRVVAGGTLELAGAYPTGAPGVLLGTYASPRLLLLAGGRLFAGNQESVSVFTVSADGTLALHPGSPFASPLPPAPPLPQYPPPYGASLAVDPTGGWLYAILDGVTLVRFSIASDGGLAYDASAPFDSGAITYPVTSLAIHPSGRWIVAAFGPDPLHLWDTSAPGPAVQLVAKGAGLAWNSAGTRLFAGGGSLTEMRVAVYAFGPAGGATARCVGMPAAPAPIAASPTSCGVTVDDAAQVAGGCSGPALASCAFDGQPSLVLGPGPADVVVTATSTSGQVSSCTSHVDVYDATPPSVTLTAAPAVLWPPNHRLVPIDLAVVASDACDPSPVVTCTAASSEPASPGPDVVWSGRQLFLRATRNGSGPGRVYAIECVATDAGGNAGAGRVQVTVPHDQGR